MILKYILSLSAILFFINIGIGQNRYDIRLEDVNTGSVNELCYMVQMRSAETYGWNMAGQNYRLYYDSERLEFNETKSNSMLPVDRYTELMLKENLTGFNALGVGELPYSGDLGLLNFSMDLKDPAQEGVDLEPDDNWINTAFICFDVSAGATPEDPVIHWAREELTANYATAYVEVTEWVEANKTIPAIGNEFYDEMSLTGILDDFFQDIKIYPNPVSDNLFIEWDNIENLDIEIWDEQGKRLSVGALPVSGNKYKINMQALPAAPYAVLLKYGDHRYFEQIVKMR